MVTGAVPVVFLARDFALSQRATAPHGCVRCGPVRSESPLTIHVRGDSGHLPLVLELDVDFSTQDRPSEADTVLHGVSADSGITLSEPDLVGQVRAGNPELP